MFKGIWQLSGVSGPILYVKIFPRSYEKHFSLQQIPVEIYLNVLNILLVHLHSFCFCFGLGLGFLGGGGQISCKPLQKFCIEHPPFTRQIYSHHKEWKSLLVMQRGMSTREDKMPGHRLHYSPSKAQVKSRGTGLKISENRRAVQDTTMKKEKESLGGDALFHTAAGEAL